MDNSDDYRALYDVSETLLVLQDLLSARSISTTKVPLDVKLSLENVVRHLQSESMEQAEGENLESPSTSIASHSHLPEVRHGVKLNRKTMLDTLYIYHQPNTLVEYPETHLTGNIGHLFAIDPSTSFNPLLSIVYSKGGPGRGIKYVYEVPPRIGSTATSGLYSSFLDNEGITVPHLIETSTCEYFYIVV